MGSKKNHNRNLLRKLLKGSEWPRPYVHQVRVWNPKKCKEELQWIPMLLIHEIVAALAAQNAGNIEFKSRESMAATPRMHLEGIERCAHN